MKAYLVYLAPILYQAIPKCIGFITELNYLYGCVFVWSVFSLSVKSSVSNLAFNTSESD